ncbi:MAG: glutathione S-transferase family protein [Myxococcota bacterium]
MTQYTLYTSPLSQHGRRVVSLFEEAQIPYAIESVAIEKGEHLQPDYTAVNPNGQLPALSIDGKILLESHTMMRFLCDTHGLEQWYPKDPWHRAQVDQWLDWNHYRVGPHVSAYVVNKVLLGADGDAALIQRSDEMLRSAFPVLESRLGDSPFVAGESTTIADLAIASNVFQMGFAQASPDSPHIAAWMERVGAHKGFQASLPPPP